MKAGLTILAHVAHAVHAFAEAAAAEDALSQRASAVPAPMTPWYGKK